MSDLCPSRGCRFRGPHRKARPLRLLQESFDGQRAADHQDEHQRTSCSGEEVTHLPEECSLTGRVGRVAEERKRSGKRDAAP